MNKLFVPLELARLAKEKGFNEPCIGYFGAPDDMYQHEGRQFYIFSRPFDAYAINEISTDCTAPTHQQLVDWFREEHNIELTPLRTIHYPGSAYIFQITYWRKDPLKEGYYEIKTQVYPNQDRGVNESGTYYEAYTEALKTALTLI